MRDRIKDLIILFFPFKDKDDNPKFRKGQSEIIQKICELCLIDGKKFICVEGPTGCGKSVINYVVLMVITEIQQEKSVYMTHQKMLQDQIGSEKWPKVKVVKGASGYSCNAINNTGDMKYRCNYDKEDMPTCNTDAPLPAFKPDADMIIKSIQEVVDNEPEDLIPYKSSFSSEQNAKDNLNIIYEMFFQTYETQMAIPRENRLPNYLDLNETFDDSVKDKLYDMAIKSISCKLKSIECPMASSRILAEMAKIRVLNPDIFFYFNKNPFSQYRYSAAIVIDEGHAFDSVMQRIFSTDIPVHLIKIIYGFDMGMFDDKSLSEVDKANGFSHFVKTHVRWLLVIIRLVRSYGACMSVKNKSTYDWNTSESIGFKQFKSAFNYYFRKYDHEISVFEILFSCVVNDNSAVTYYRESIMQDGYFDEEYVICIQNFVNSVKATYSKIKDDIEPEGENVVDMAKLSNNIKYYLGKERIKRRLKKSTEISIKRPAYDSDIASEDYIVYEYLDNLYKLMDNINSIMSVISIDNENDVPMFLLDTDERNQLDICSGTKLYRDANKFSAGKFSSIRIIPIRPDVLANKFFYNMSPHIIITSGTWIYPRSQMKVLGINPDKASFLKIPSTFDKERRPVYIMDNDKYTNYSAKNEDGIYTYETEHGKKKAAKEVCDIVNKIKVFINKHHNVNTNIIIHCHSFKLAEIVAKYGPSVYDVNYVIHSSNHAGDTIQNLINDTNVRMFSKEELLNVIRKNANQGITIISPSLSEGVDFKGDLVRAQIIMKHPIPYWGDKYLRSHVNGMKELGIVPDYTFSDRIIYMTLLQQYGRVMRDEKDWGYTFILDQKSVECFSRILSRAGNKIRSEMNAEYLFEAVRCRHVNGEVKFLLPFPM